MTAATLNGNRTVVYLLVAINVLLAGSAIGLFSNRLNNLEERAERRDEQMRKEIMLLSNEVSALRAEMGIYRLQRQNGCGQ